MNNDAHNPPVYRLTISFGRIDLEHWSQALAPVASNADALRNAAERGVFLANLHHLSGEDEDRREIAISPLDPAAATPDFVIDALLPWAAAVGHHRVWLPDRMLDVASDGLPAGPARVTCETCGARWTNGDEGFFAMVREYGCFPSACWMCGRSMPQWTIDGIQQSLFDREAAA